MDLSGELARSLLDAAPDPTVIVDGSGIIVFANARVEDAFGYQPAELLGQPVEALLPNRYRDAHPTHRARFFSTPEPRPMGIGLQLFGLHKDGREFPVEISLSPVVTPAGILVSSSIRDVSAQRETERQLAAANRAKSRFLAAASHDLRQPLQALNLLNEVAANMAAGDAELQGVVDKEQKALDSMSGLLSSLLDISKLDAGIVIPDLEDCDLEALFGQLRIAFEDQAAAKKLDLIIECSDQAARTDPTLLRQLLANVISNAIRYTPTGSVRIRSHEEESLVCIEVIDSGVGIRAEDMPRIFDEFYQVDHGTRRPEGLGLGLSIVKRISELLNCPIEIDSTPGNGSTFQTYVPRGELTQPAKPPVPAAAGKLGGTILLVDDEEVVAEATALLLEMEGFAVKLATCQRDALGHVQEQAPDLIISDYHLRGQETGAGVVTVLRAHLGCDVPVLFITGDTSSVAGADVMPGAEYLTKPLRGDELLAAIGRRLSGR
jgi:PAS domain S-box-containing protein